MEEKEIKTTDGGLNWQQTGLSFQLTQGDASLIRKIMVNPTNSNQLVACGASGMYTSNDAGVNWIPKMDSLFWDMVQDPSNSNILYAATGWISVANIGTAGIYKSTDFGSTWSLLNTGIPLTGTVQRIKLAIAPSDPNYIYAIAVDDNSGFYGIYKSTNAGTNWQFFPAIINVLDGSDGLNSGGQGTYDLALMVNATDRNTIYTGGVNIYGSLDGGQNFEPVSHWTLNFGPTLHGDIHMIDRQPLTGNVFVCSDGGVYRTSNIIIHSWNDANNGIPWPTVWTNLSDGLAITSFYRISSSKGIDGHILAGAQDNASFYFDGSFWQTIIGGDGMDNIIDPVNTQNMIGASQYGNFYGSNDGGFSFNGLFTNPNNEVSEWTAPIVGDAQGNLYVGNSNVMQSTDGGFSWNQISFFPFPGFADNEISALAVSSSNNDYIYAGKRVRYEFGVSGTLYMTSNGGGIWNDVTAGIPDSLYYTSIDVHHSNAATAYISMAGFSAGNKIFKTTNGGSAWQNISYNLPNLPVNCVKNIPGTNMLLAATDIGVYLLDSASTSWTMQSTGLPNVIVSDIEFNVPLNKIYVSTFGRGIWETSLSFLVSTPSIIAKENTIELFPAVNQGEFIIRFSEENSDLVNLQLIDIKGAVVYETSIDNNESKHKVSLLPGKYFAKISGERIHAVKSFIVM
jgi:photosystem II stability/assembly factor-like uncharacterized protein